MQFELNHKIGQQKINVKFSTTLPFPANLELGVMLCRIGGEMIGDFSWNFPMFITSQVIQEIIHNTCFKCGGLMRDGEQLESFPPKQVRRCQSCGHSHT